MLSPLFNTVLQQEEHSLFIQETQTQLPARLKSTSRIRHTEDEAIPTRRCRETACGKRNNYHPYPRGYTGQWEPDKC